MLAVDARQRKQIELSVLACTWQGETVPQNGEMGLEYDRQCICHGNRISSIQKCPRPAWPKRKPLSPKRDEGLRAQEFA